ncbi:MAG: Dyp-type peroxidase [Kineosporiaceae bacterium]
MTRDPAHSGVTRRSLLASAGGMGAALVGAGAVAACTSRGEGAGTARVDAPSGDAGGSRSGGARFVPFAGRHQAGVTALPVPQLGLLAAFRSVAPDRAALERGLRELTDEIRGLMAGDPVERRDPALPPVDSGLLGPEPPPDDLGIVVSVGASLFDDRYGLAPRRPVQLVEMPFLANDRLDPAKSHGDLLLSLEAGHPDTLQFALRQLMRRTREWLVLAWLVDGYTRGTGDPRDGAPRNLMGFKDGTANLDASDEALMDRHVWVQPEDTVDAGGAEPAWTVDGSYHVVRVIRMLVEFWDRTRLSEQEAVIGRHKLSGAPLGGTDENETPDFTGDPDGDVTPLDAHIRLANPRTPESADSLILRRGFSYAAGFDRAGQLDQGLAFVCYQRDLAGGFLAVQERLTGEPLEEYTLPVGGGFFFALPGVAADTGFLGEGLVAS